MCKCVLPPGVNPIAVDKYIDININKITGIIKISVFIWNKITVFPFVNGRAFYGNNFIVKMKMKQFNCCYAVCSNVTKGDVACCVK
jgi:hypothetical protein